MSRNEFRHTMSPLEYYWRGEKFSTTSSTSYLFDLKRALPSSGSRDGDWLHPTDYWASRITEIGMQGEWQFQQFGGDNRYVGCLGAVSSGSYVPVGYELVPYEPNYLSRAIISARKQLLGEDALNFLQNFAERKQAIDLVADRLTSIRRGYQYARKRQWKKAFRALGLHNQKVARRLSENVLAWNYGVAPLADDIVKAVNMVSNPKPENFLMVRGTAGNGGGVHREVIDDRGTLPRKVDYTEKHLAVCVMYVKPENEAAIRRAALMVNNPFLLGYELIPGSFLLDWVWDIGGWLTAMGATSGWSFYSGYTMERTEGISSYRGHTSKTYGTSTILSGNMRQVKQFRRARLHAFPLPGNPGFKNPFSLIHALNAVALFGARL